MEGSRSVHIITDPDPDPSGPKDPTDPDPEHCWKLKISQRTRVVRVGNYAYINDKHNTYCIGLRHGFAGGGLPYYCTFVQSPQLDLSPISWCMLCCLGASVGLPRDAVQEAARYTYSIIPGIFIWKLETLSYFVCLITFPVYIFLNIQSFSGIGYISYKDCELSIAFYRVRTIN